MKNLKYLSDSVGQHLKKILEEEIGSVESIKILGILWVSMSLKNKVKDSVEHFRFFFKNLMKN